MSENIDKIIAENIERFLSVRSRSKGLHPQIVYSLGTADEPIDLTVDDLHAAIRALRHETKEKV